MKIIDDNFVDAMAECFYQGTKKDNRRCSDWKNLKWNKNLELLYTSKLIGHMSEGVRAKSAEERRKHLAAVACNANILWHYQKE